jgi:hypothetical protein
MGVAAVAACLATGAFAVTGDSHRIRAVGKPAAAPPPPPTVAGACSMATALRVGKPFFFDPGMTRPIWQVLCGAFTGSGSEAMAIAFSAPTCWPTQWWAVFRRTEGAWRRVLYVPAYLDRPLVAVGNDIRETTAVARRGDPRCFPSGGSRTRIWHWNGRRFVAGPWKQVPAGTAKDAAFYSPSKNISCELHDHGSGAGVSCQSFNPPQRATLDTAGRFTSCRGSAVRCKVRHPGGAVPTLAYGKRITVGRFHCNSLELGVICVVSHSRKGFLIARDGINRVG